MTEQTATFDSLFTAKRFFSAFHVHASRAGARHMITLLERRVLPVTEGGGWSRQAQAPGIQRDGVSYDADFDRVLADLPLNGVRSQHSLRSYAYDLVAGCASWTRRAARPSGKPRVTMSLGSGSHL